MTRLREVPIMLILSYLFYITWRDDGWRGIVEILGIFVVVWLAFEILFKLRWEK